MSKAESTYLMMCWNWLLWNSQDSGIASTGDPNCMEYQMRHVVSTGLT